MGFKSVFKTVAPFLAQTVQLAVPGPLGTMAAGILTKVTGSQVKPADVQDTMAKLAQTDEGLLKLKEAENQYQLAATQLGFDHVDKIAELENEDRDSARKMQIANKSWVPAALAVVVTIGFFGLLTLLLFYTPPPANDKLFTIMLTSLGTAWVGIIAYYFGSSVGSARKTELLAQAPPVPK